MKYIKLKLKNDSIVEVSIELKDNTYYYIEKTGDTVTTIGSTKKPPRQLSDKTQIGKYLKKLILQLKDSLKGENLTIDDRVSSTMTVEEVWNDEYKLLMNKLSHLLKEAKVQKAKKADEKEQQKEAYYDRLYDYYVSRRDEYGLTDLQFIGQLSLGLGVGLHNIVLKMFVNHMLTITKIKPSNQIVYSKQASGKSFIIEQTLKMIPDEFVINGRTTVAFFFNELDGKDVSGHIFNFGDLGGDNDNENTIEVRDLVKILNTDGIVERGISAADNTPITQTVVGKPSLTYSTVDASIINEQEKSRGSVFSPPLIDEFQLTAFNQVQSAPGRFRSTLELIDKDVESVKGLVWKLKDELVNYEIFNPYAFNVSSFLESMDDFNRKIGEFDKTLLVVTYLNDPFVLDNGDKKLMIASKQDVVNALALFEGKDNLLPNHRLCIENIVKVFELDESYADYYTSGDDYKKAVDEYNKFMTNEIHSDVTTGDKFDNNYRWDVDVNNADSEGDSKVLFTISILRKKFSKQRWFSRVKNNLSDVLRSLYEYGYLLKFKGKIDKENVYCLPLDIKEKLANVAPEWGGTGFKIGLDLCSHCYPDLFGEAKEFVSKDCQKRVVVSNLELNNCTVYNLIWENYTVNFNPSISVDDDSQSMMNIHGGANEQIEGASEQSRGANEESRGASEPNGGANEKPKMAENAPIRKRRRKSNEMVSFQV